MVDAILNSKLSLIRARKIEVNAKAWVPDNLRIAEIDLCVVIGNLLDNAMEACLRQPPEEHRFIRVFLGVLKNQLYLSVSNSMAGAARKSGGKYASTKGTEGHGYGLLRVDRIAEKYGGYVNRQSEEGALPPRCCCLCNHSCKKTRSRKNPHIPVEAGYHNHGRWRNETTERKACL